MIEAGLREHFQPYRPELNPDLDDLSGYPVFLVARLEGALVGTGGLRLASPGLARVKRMSTHVAYRRRGVANAVLDGLIVEARARGLERLRLVTGLDWSEALRLYVRAGFVEVGQVGDASGFRGLEFELRLE